MDKNKMNAIADQVRAYEAATPVVQLAYKGTLLKYHAVNETTLWRIRTLGTKEPMTISWMEKFPTGAVFYDVGANVGMYTIFAAVTRGAQVFSFEPEAQNYAILNKNILVNNVSDRVVAYNVALSDDIRVDRLYMANNTVGGSCHSFAEEVGFDLQPRKSKFQQGAIGMSLDEMVVRGKLPLPEYLKIDVDGFEHLVCAGGKNVLASQGLREICIELNPAMQEHQEVIQKIVEAGFTYDPAEVEQAARKSGAFQGVGEYFFRRIS